MCNVNIPRKDNSNLELTLKAGKTTIIIGANGSGKTRLAVYLEEQLGEKAHRIAAHRALSLNPNVDRIPETKARQYLTYGAQGIASQFLIENIIDGKITHLLACLMTLIVFSNIYLLNKLLLLLKITKNSIVVKKLLIAKLN